MMVNKLASLVVVPMLEELFGVDKLQDKLAFIYTISFLFSLLVSLLEVSDLGVLVEFTSPVATPTSTAPLLLLPLAPITILLVVESSMAG